MSEPVIQHGVGPIERCPYCATPFKWKAFSLAHKCQGCHAIIERNIPKLEEHPTNANRST